MSIKIKEQVSLQPYNTMAVPALARYFVEVSSQTQLVDALDYARANNLEKLILGEGSNTIFVGDFSGLVIHIALKGIQVLSENKDSVDIRVAAGENWHDFVRYTVEKSWSGLQNLALIPGLVGAAPVQNIGAYGAELKDQLISLEYLDLYSGELKSLTNAGCEFAYRDSIFKGALRNRSCITSIDLRLWKTARAHTSYPALAATLLESKYAEPYTVKQVFDAVCKIRASKLPDPKKIPNTGSFFKNPVVTASQLVSIKNSYPKIVHFTVDGGYKLAAAWLIENAGWKRRSINGVSVHENQALVVTNPNHNSGQAVLDFAKEVQKDIFAKFEVDLEIEPQVIIGS